MIPWITISNVSEKALWWLAGAAFKGSIVLFGAFLLLHFLKRASASTKHWIWVLALVSTLLLPAWIAISPQFSLPILPAAASTGPSLKDLARIQSQAKQRVFSNSEPLSNGIQQASLSVNKAKTGAYQVKAAPTKPVPSTAKSDFWLPWSMLVLCIWLGGVCLLLARWLSQSWQAYQTIRRGMPIHEETWSTLLNHLSRNVLHIRRPVWLVIADVETPMTWGFWKPVIVLPAEAEDWTLERRRVVLLHELAHISRKDYLTQWLAVISCAFNWFNPLVWQAMRQLSIQREQACDDRVLAADTLGYDYASHLLAIAQSAVNNRRMPLGMLSFARRSHLGHRIQRILDATQSRAPLTINKALLLTVLVALILFPIGNIRLSRANAQQNGVVLSLARPSWMKDAISDQMIKDFETDNPGVTVRFVDSTFVSDPASEMPQFFSSMQQYASSADVVYAWGITPEATEAGYYLNLAPFASADAKLNSDDFYPALWQSYQWDNGLWALPTSAYVSLLTYDPAAFDKVGLAYPTDQWTLDDFVNAVRKLSIVNADNVVTTPGFSISKGGYYSLYRSFIDANLANTDKVPNVPQFDTPSVEAFLTAWSQLDQQGMIGTDPFNAPLSIVPAQFLDGKQASVRKAVLLPGGHGGLDTVDAFAISAGTQHPDAAYALVKFLSSKADIPSSFRALPARKSLVSQLGQGKPYSAETQALIDKGIANSFSVADLRYADYLDSALNLMKTQSLNAKDALQTVETTATSNQQAALAKKSTLALVIATPIPQAPLPAGKIALNFDVSFSSSQGLPNQALWDQLSQQFVSSDPQVGQINLLHGNDRLQDALNKSDCFYLPVNAVPAAPANALINLDPLMAADQNFNSADIVPSVMDAVKRDNKIWAYPLTIVPTMLLYDSDAFSKAGAAQPTNDWTIDQFVDALQMLQANHPTPPFVDYEGDGTSLLQIIAAYGGDPLDYRTTPVTINFTDPDTVNAIRQALDLARKGEIEYRALGASLGLQQRKPDFTTPLYPTPLDMVMFNQNRRDGVHKYVLYPHGSKFNSVAYQIGAGYISAKAQNPDACYRWLGFLSQHPELFYAFPVRDSQVNNPALVSAAGPDVAAAYKQLDVLLKDNRTIPIPMLDPSITTPTDFLARHWLYQAFDTYVLHDSDLDSALKTAEENAQSFQACVANLPSVPVDSLGTDNQRPYIDCAVKVDPSLQSQLGG